MLYTKEAVQANLRNWEGKRVFYLGKGDQLTSDARDFLTRERIEILPAEQAARQRYQLLGGGFMEGKPEHMTHLNAEVLVEKNHPRILLRGAVDSLEAELLLCAREAEGDLRRDVESVLAYVRKLLSWEVLDKPVEEVTFQGMGEQELRSRSHRPQDFYGQPHFMPESADERILLLLNKCRCQARSAELAAVAAFGSTRQDLIRGFNRISSFLYLLMIQQKANRRKGTDWTTKN